MGLCVKYTLFTFSFLILVSEKFAESVSTRTVLIMPSESVELLKGKWFTSFRPSFSV